MDDASYKNKGVFAKEEMVASTAVSKSLKKCEGWKYEVAKPWKGDRILPNNSNAAFKRLENTEKRLLKRLMQNIAKS